MLAETAKLHGVGDLIDPVQAGQDQRKQDLGRILQPFKELDVLA